jgi:Mechanosensitive ion channel, conserved TM helix
MWDSFVREMLRAMDEIVKGFARFLPRFMEMLVIALVGWVIAFLLRAVLRSVLKITRFDKLSEHTGATELLRGAALPSLTELVSRLVFWLAWVGFILLGINVLGIAGLDQHVAAFFAFLPRLAVSLFILFFGLLAASFLARAVLLGAVNADLPSPKIISWAVRTMIILLVLSMSFEELGISSRTVIVAFGMTFGALMLGLALAFGLGGQDLARQYLEKRFARDSGDHAPEREDELSPL